MKGKSNHVDDANFSSPLPAIIFSCKIGMERKRCNEEENDTTDTWSIVIEYLLSISVEKSCSFPMGTQFNDFHWCSAKKVRKWSVALQRNRVTFWKFRHHLILAYGTWRWQEGSDTEFGHCSMNPQLHSHLHFILKRQKRIWQRGWYYWKFNSGEIKTKLLALGLPEHYKVYTSSPWYWNLTWN